MTMDHEKFKNLASGAQSLAIAIAVVIGGVWTLYTFKALGTVNKARAEIREIEHRSNIEQPVLAIELQAKPVTTGGKNVHLVHVEAKFRNDGKRNLNLTFDEPSLTVSKLKLDTNSTEVEGEVISREPTLLNADGTLEQVRERALRPSQSRDVPFVVAVPSPGIYLVQIKATYSGLNLEDGKLVPSSDEPIYAYTQTIVEVP